MLSGKWQPFCLDLNVLSSKPQWNLTQNTKKIEENTFQNLACNMVAILIKVNMLYKLMSHYHRSIYDDISVMFITSLEKWPSGCGLPLSQWNDFTHWGQNKITDSLQTTSSNAFSWIQYYCISIRITLNFVSTGPIIIASGNDLWPRVCRWHFQMHILELKLLHFNSNYTKLCF